MIVAIGAFDGYHLGHRLLLAEARRIAEENKTAWGVVTFSPHPSSYFDPQQKLLFTEPEKSAVAKFLGVPRIITIRFDDALCKMPPLEFLHALDELVGLTGIVVGDDFRFGAGAVGDSAAVRSFCVKKGISFSVVNPLEYNKTRGTGRKLSTSVLRKWAEQGDMANLRRFLGFPFPISGRVIHGEARGATLGYPTANISVPDSKILPVPGVFAGSVFISGEWKACAVFVGKPPTFGAGNERGLEAFILNFGGDLYGKNIVIFLEEYLRQPKKYDNTFELVKGITQSVRDTEDIFKRNHAESAYIYGELEKIFSSAPTNPNIVNLNDGSVELSKKSYISLDQSRVTEIFHPNFVENVNFSLAEATVRPGECTLKHTHTDSTEIYYGLEGAGFMSVFNGEKEEKTVFTAGSSVLIRPNTPHCVRAVNDAGGTPLRFLCYCTPPYTHEQTKLLQ